MGIPRSTRTSIDPMNLTRHFPYHRGALDAPEPGTRERQVADAVALVSGEPFACATAGLFAGTRIGISREDHGHVASRLDQIEQSVAFQSTEIMAVRSEVAELGRSVNELKKLVGEIRSGTAGHGEQLLDKLIARLGGPMPDSTEIDPGIMSVIFSPDDGATGEKEEDEDS